jgi:hypothetical protein
MIKDEQAMNRSRRSFCAAGALLVAGCAATPPDPRTEAIAQLGATGKLRAAINFGNPTLANTLGRFRRALRRRYSSG